MRSTAYCTGNGDAKVLLLSFYEAELQPLTIASSASFLKAAEVEVAVVDTFVQELADDVLASASYLGVSLPLYQSLERAKSFYPRLKETDKPIIAFGQHATLASGMLLDSGLAHWVIRGDWEEPLVRLVQSLEKNGGSDAKHLRLQGVYGQGQPVETCPSYVNRGLRFLAPDRSGLPPLTSYRYALVERFIGDSRVVGNVETSRGCHHSCLHCSVFAVYANKVVMIPGEVVLEDICNCVELGAEHICFVDAEFLNSGTHALKIVRAMHREFPGLTFDFTSRPDHLLEHAACVEEMVELGARFVISAIEFPNDRILRLLGKELTVDQCVRAIGLCRRIGLGFYPTFIVYNPWASMADLSAFGEFLQETGLQCQMDPLQLGVRLNLPKGSLLVGSSLLDDIELEEAEFRYEWSHPDPLMDLAYEAATREQKQQGFRRCCIRC